MFTNAMPETLERVEDLGPIEKLQGIREWAEEFDEVPDRSVIDEMAELYGLDKSVVYGVVFLSIHGLS